LVKRHEGFAAGTCNRFILLAVEITLQYLKMTRQHEQRVVRRASILPLIQNLD